MHPDDHNEKSGFSVQSVEVKTTETRVLPESDRLMRIERDANDAKLLAVAHEKFLFGRVDEDGERHPGLAQKLDQFVTEFTQLKSSIMLAGKTLHTYVAYGSRAAFGFSITLVSAVIWYTAHHWSDFLRFASGINH